jgi:hypothetical protein
VRDRKKSLKEFKKIIFLLKIFHQGWKRASTEGTEGTTMLLTSNPVPALMSNMFGTPPR